MKKMKNMLTLLLAAAMVLALTACGGNGGNGGSDATMGQSLKAVFEANSDQDAQTLADTILADKQIDFDTMTMPVEPGFLMGFRNEIHGFKTGVSFGPMISTIPFIGYIFELEEGADVDAFVAELEANANLRWNVCTEAEELVIDTEGNTVFFLMCPKSMEDEA